MLFFEKFAKNANFYYFVEQLVHLGDLFIMGKFFS